MHGPTRRQLLLLPLAPQLALAGEAALRVPVLCVRNIHAKCTPRQMREFNDRVWNEALFTLEKSGIHLDVLDREGEVLKYPSDRPRIIGLARNRLNIVLTDHLPMYWDHGRSLGGLSTVYEGCHLCMVGIQNAHGFRIPFLSVNSVVHELLHIFLMDVFTASDGGLMNTHTRESRVDWYATRMWLFHDGAAVRESVQQYLKRFHPGD
jgi:hypothetical protein